MPGSFTKTEKTINLSILDFKFYLNLHHHTVLNPINLSILDFKYNQDRQVVFSYSYKSIHIGF